MRPLLLSTILLLSGAAYAGTSPKADWIVHVWPGYRSTESFERIGEYFGGEETHPGRIVLRTRPAERSGYYFLIRLKTPQLPQEAKVWRLQVVIPGIEKPVTHDFPVNPKALEKVLELGLTGADWPSPQTHPNAWRLALVSADGIELLTKQSFLWR